MSPTEQDNNMPMVNGKKYAYTKKGKAAAKKAMSKGKSFGSMVKGGKKKNS